MLYCARSAMRKPIKYLAWVFGIAIVAALIVILFGRFVLAPEEARVACDKYAREGASKENNIVLQEKAYDLLYDSCFRQKGLAPEK